MGQTSLCDEGARVPLTYVITPPDEWFHRQIDQSGLIIQCGACSVRETETCGLQDKAGRSRFFRKGESEPRVGETTTTLKLVNQPLSLLLTNHKAKTRLT